MNASDVANRNLPPSDDAARAVISPVPLFTPAHVPHRCPIESEFVVVVVVVVVVIV